MIDTHAPPRRTPSVSELQAALLAARQGTFAAATRATWEAPEPISSPPPPPGVEIRAAAPAWLVGTHGASGADYLATVLPEARMAGKDWPADECEPGSPVVLVCRSNHEGLSSAQDYARAYRDRGLAERIRLLGVIVSADAPGRLPTPLRRRERLLSGAVPILGHVPWQPAWRLGPPQPGPDPEPWVEKLAAALEAAAR